MLDTLRKATLFAAVFLLTGAAQGGNADLDTDIRSDALDNSAKRVDRIELLKREKNNGDCRTTNKDSKEKQQDSKPVSTKELSRDCVARRNPRKPISDAKRGEPAAGSRY